MGWVLAGGLAIVSFIVLAFVLKLPRRGWEATAAALLLGLWLQTNLDYTATAAGKVIAGMGVPALIAGPIVRHNDLIPQFRQQRSRNDDLATGVTLFTIASVPIPAENGLALNAAGIINAYFVNVSTTNCEFPPSIVTSVTNPPAAVANPMTAPRVARPIV